MRRLLTVVALTTVLVLAGCTGEGSFGEEAEFDGRWSAEETSAFYVGDGLDYAVIRLRNTSRVELSRDDGLGGEQPLRIDHVRFRHPNGTVTNVSDHNTTGSSTVVTLPADRGRLGYVVRQQPGRFNHPMPVDGSARVVLPPGTDARNVALGAIAPGDETVVSEDPLILQWEEVERDTLISVRYYSEDDPVILIGLLTLLVVAAAGVFVYYRRVFDTLHRRTRELEE